MRDNIFLALQALDEARRNAERSGHPDVIADPATLADVKDSTLSCLLGANAYVGMALVEALNTARDRGL